ncbi:MAG: VgrG-related protein [Hyphomicrobiales bacterium]
MKAPDLLSQFYVKHNGSYVPSDFMAAVVYLEVDDSLHLPTMFEIELDDPRLQWIDDLAITIGSEFEFQANSLSGPGGNEKPVRLFVGEVTAIEPHFPAGGKQPRLVIRGYDRSHRLHTGRKVRTFLQKTDSDIIAQIARECGLKPNIAETSQVHEYVVQDNQTNYEFLQDRARRVGHVLRVDRKQLISQPAREMTDEGPSLEWGKNLFSFHPRMSVAAQPSSVMVRGWDPKKKQEIKIEAKTPQLNSSIGMRMRAGRAYQSAFPAGTLSVVTRPVRTQHEAAHLAQAVLNDVAQSDLQAEGLCRGDGKIRAGTLIQVSNVGKRFSGKYFVTRARHRYTPEDGYLTNFDASSRGTDTVAELVSEGLTRPEMAGGRRERMVGVAVGIVTNLADPERMGRVKVKFPWLDDSNESNWARIAVPMAGNNRGIEFMPEVNDEVLVAFEHGDVNYPYIVGFLWNGMDNPPIPDSEMHTGSKVRMRRIRSAAGHVVTFVEESGKEKIEIIDKTQANKIIIDSSTGEILVESKQKVTVKTQEAMVDAKTKATVKSATVDVEANPGKLTLKGASGVDIDGGPMVTVKGGIIRLN